MLGLLIFGPVFLGIILLIVGFLFKNRWIVIRYLLWIPALLLFCFSFWINYNHNSKLKKYEKELTGVFKINLERSNLRGYSPEKYNTLTLVVRDDNTFEVSPAVPFIKVDKGNWSFKDFELSSAVLEGDNDEEYVNATGDYWQFNLPSPRGNENQVERIVFNRMK